MYALHTYLGGVLRPDDGIKKGRTSRKILTSMNDRTHRYLDEAVKCNNARFTKETFTSVTTQCFSRYRYDEPDTSRYFVLFILFFILELAYTSI